LSRFKEMNPRTSIRTSMALAVAGLLAFMLYLYFFVGFDSMLEILRKVDPLEYSLYYSLTIAAIVVSLFFYSMTWHELLKELSLNLSIRKAFLYSWVGNFVDLVVPLETISGEVTRLYLIKGDVENDLGKAVASLVYHRIISVSTTLIALVASSIYLILAYQIQTGIILFLSIVAAGTTVTVLLLLYLSISGGAAKRIVDLLIRVISVFVKDERRIADLRERAMGDLSVFHASVKSFGRNPRFLIRPFIYSYLSWFSQLAIYLLVFYALGISWVLRCVPQMIVVFSITLAVQTIPVGFPVGLVEFVMTYLYNMLLSTSPAVNGLATSLIRVVTFWFQVMVGFLIVQWLGIRRVLQAGSYGNEREQQT
jgi:uncharacterized protein (TIRG00374 family)